MLPYGRTWNCRIARLEGEKLEEAELLDEGRRATNGRNRDANLRRSERERKRVCVREKERETEREKQSMSERYVVCAWRGWRLPHEALRAELSYPYRRALSGTHTRTHVSTERARGLI